jgi:uncharacterized Ntn-hydrolase superfamily protein
VTASIIARDPATGELGVAVFTAYPSVGMRVPFAEAGVGAIATQARAERSFGPRGLQLLRAGASASEVVEQLIAADAGSADRQLGVMDADGGSAGFTGSGCVIYAGAAEGPDCRCQANMMRSEGVPEAMAAAFAGAPGELSLRLLAALEGGQEAGGDVRGRMSAALRVVPATGEPWRASVDLRVDHHEDPLPELTRALTVHRAYALIDAAAEHARAGDGEAAMKAGMDALALTGESDPQLIVWLGLGAAQSDLATGTALVRHALELDPALATLVERLPESFAPAAPAVRAELAG